VQFPIRNNKIQLPHHRTPLAMAMDDRCDDDERRASVEEHDPRALELLVATVPVGTRSEARYLLMSGSGDSFVAVAPVRVHVWSARDQVSVVDIDGTITKSNVRGVMDTVVTGAYEHCHDGVCQFLSSVPRSRFLYLTSRPISIANATRKFLSELRQQACHRLPDGALLGFRGTLVEVLVMELFKKSTHEFKTRALLDSVVRLFERVGGPGPCGGDVGSPNTAGSTDSASTNGAGTATSAPSARPSGIFVAGFGNTLMDVQAYHAVGMRPDQIYLIDPSSKICCLDHHHHDGHHHPLHDQNAVAPTDGKRAVPQVQKDYLLLRGSWFSGYSDKKLLTHIVRDRGEDDDADGTEAGQELEYAFGRVKEVE
jgi:phosphatidate phosphatase LPIN